jgi:thiamine-phosphate diphosphorylase / hydroxyethylthiazole kinase
MLHIARYFSEDPSSPDHSKTNSKSIIGTAGTRTILEGLAHGGHAAIRTVCIGGINHSNVQRVLYQSTAPEKQLDGVAVVSAIVAAEDPKRASKRFQELISASPPFGSSGELRSITPELLEESCYALVEAVGRQKPLCHNMTNLVVQNFAANVALSMSALSLC